MLLKRRIGVTLCRIHYACFHGIIIDDSIKLSGRRRAEFQMQYGSIGWSVGAVLGYALATQGVYSGCAWLCGIVIGA
jgi:hypothetical protein